MIIIIQFDRLPDRSSRRQILIIVPPSSPNWVVSGTGYHVHLCVFVCSCSSTSVRTNLNKSACKKGHFWKVRTLWLLAG